MAVPFTFGTATASIPLSQLDSNFATVITLGNTAIQLGNTVTTLNNMTLANVTISSGNVTLTNVTITTANVTTANVVTLIVTGNETVQGNTTVTGTITGAKLIPTGSSVTGNGLYLPAANSVGISTNGTNAVYIDSTQKVGIGAISSGATLAVTGTLSATGKISTTQGGVVIDSIGITPTTGTDRGIIRITNTGGDTIFGMDSSAGGTTITGASAYDGIVRSATGLSFGSASALWMRSSATGLAVTGALSTTGDITGTGSNIALKLYASNGSSPQILLGNSSLTTHWSIFETLGGAGQQGSFNIYDNVAAASRLAIATSTGNVGIGTTSPGAKLDIVGATSNQIRVGTAATEHYRIGRNSSDGLLDFFGSQTGFQGYSFGGIDGTWATINSSGNLGLGLTPSGTFRLQVKSSGNNLAQFKDSAANEFAYAVTTDGAGQIKHFATYTSSGTAAYHAWYPTTAAGVQTQAMTLDSNGNLLVGTTTTSLSSSVNGFVVNSTGTINAYRAGGVVGYFNRNTNDGTILSFRTSDVERGSVSISGSVTSYNTTSDQRLKENIQDADSASSLIDALQVRKFDWKADSSHQRYGFVAQELVTVAPEAVHQPADADEMMAVDYSKLVPMLVKEIQSLRKRLADAGIA